METILKYKIAPEKMIELFDNHPDKVNIRHFEAIGRDSIPISEEHIPIFYRIRIRHAENEDAKTLLKNAIKKLKI